MGKGKGGIMGKEKIWKKWNDEKGKKWNIGIVEEWERKDKKKIQDGKVMEELEESDFGVDWFSPNIPIFQHSNLPAQYSIIPTFHRAGTWHRNYNTQWSHKAC